MNTDEREGAAAQEFPPPPRRSRLPTQPAATIEPAHRREADRAVADEFVRGSGSNVLNAAYEVVARLLAERDALMRVLEKATRHSNTFDPDCDGPFCFFCDAGLDAPCKPDCAYTEARILLSALAAHPPLSR